MVVVAPERIGRYSPSTGNYSTVATPKITSETFDIEVGDRFWCQSQAEAGSSQTVVTPSVSSGAIDWTLQARTPDSSDTNLSALWGWSGICTSAAADVTIQVARPSSNTSLFWGFSVTHVRGSSGIGVVWDANNTYGSSAPLSTQTVQEHSLVIFNVNDWNALDGASRAYRMSAVESNYLWIDGRHTVYGAYVLDTAGGSFNAGLTTPSTMRWGLIGIEFLGTEVATDPVPALQESGAGILLEDGTRLMF
jgi:hypothetical protein